MQCSDRNDRLRQQGASSMGASTGIAVARPIGDRQSNPSAHTFCFGQHRLQQACRSSESSVAFVFAASLSHQSSAATLVGCPFRIGPGMEAWLVVSCSLEALGVVFCSSRLPAGSADGHRDLKLCLARGRHNHAKVTYLHEPHQKFCCSKFAAVCKTTVLQNLFAMARSCYWLQISENHCG